MQNAENILFTLTMVAYFAAMAGYDPNVVQGLVNGVMAGHDRVARDVINGVYGNGTDRVINLRRAGYSDADINSIQNLVNHTLWR